MTKIEPIILYAFQKKRVAYFHRIFYNRNTAVSMRPEDPAVCRSDSNIRLYGEESPEKRIFI